MIEIHVYGHLKKKFFPGASLAEDTIIRLPDIKDECLADLLNRLGLSASDHGDCFVNHEIVIDPKKTLVSSGSRVAIFSNGMYLIDGGQYIKGHGYITKKPPVKINYYY